MLFTMLRAADAALRCPRAMAADAASALRYADTAAAAAFTLARGARRR